VSTATDLLIATLPEFLGSLCAALVVAAVTAGVRRFRRRRTLQAAEQVRTDGSQAHEEP
jgi:hypothetical protein